jgi:hypothetical protein
MADDKKPKLPKRVHPDDRARIGFSNVIAEVSGNVHVAGPDVSYYSPELIQCTLPHSDPKSRDWIKKNGDFSLIVSSGIDDEGATYGIPYGSFPRLVLAHIITRVIETREKRIELTSHFGSFLREIGYLGNHKGKGVKGQRVREQLLRLLNANISFQRNEEGHNQRLNINISRGFDLWWDYKKPEQGSLFGSWVLLSDDFYESIIKSPVPLRTDILKALKKSPLAIDIYMWVAYRLFSMHANHQDELSLSYGALQNQFGTGISEDNYRQFRKEFKSAFNKVAALYQPHTGDTGKPILNYALNDTGLVLYRSPLLIGRNKPTKQDDIGQIIKSRNFDLPTVRKARLIAGNWSVEYLTDQYFKWIEGESITPIDPRRHFLAFIESHVKRNGKG